MYDLQVGTEQTCDLVDLFRWIVSPISEKLLIKDKLLPLLMHWDFSLGPKEVPTLFPQYWTVC